MKNTLNQLKEINQKINKTIKSEKDDYRRDVLRQIRDKNIETILEITKLELKEIIPTKYKEL